jgi:tetratricopeptide (TPR) repeat protein
MISNTKGKSSGRYKRSVSKKQEAKIEVKKVGCKSSDAQKQGAEIEIIKVNHEHSTSDKKWLEIENKYRRQATQLKKEKRYDEAVECLRKARNAQYNTDEFWSIDTLLRIPKCLILAKQYKEAYDEAMQISEFKWKVLGMIPPTVKLTKAHLRYQALEIAYKAACEMNDDELISRTNKLLRESLQILKKGDF